MNWYSVFYWVTVADGVKHFFDVMSDVLMWFTCISFIVFWVIFIASRDERTAGEAKDEKERKSDRYWQTAVRRLFIWSFTLCFIFWAGYIFLPSKKDALIIIAGGAVGNFITSDSSARQIPAELTLLLREKLKAEIMEVKGGTMDTLAKKSKEELIELLKKKNE